MKVKHIIILFLIGLAIMILGALFKVQHWPGAGIIIIIAPLVKIVAVILAIFKVYQLGKFNDFLNS
jgi:hypothetical protein